MSNVRKLRGEDYFTFDMAGGHFAGDDHVIMVDYNVVGAWASLRIKPARSRRLRIAVNPDGSINLSLE